MVDLAVCSLLSKISEISVTTRLLTSIWFKNRSLNVVQREKMTAFNETKESAALLTGAAISAGHARPQRDEKLYST